MVAASRVLSSSRLLAPLALQGLRFRETMAAHPEGHR